MALSLFLYPFVCYRVYTSRVQIATRSADILGGSRVVMLGRFDAQRRARKRRRVEQGQVSYGLLCVTLPWQSTCSIPFFFPQTQSDGTDRRRRQRGRLFIKMILGSVGLVHLLFFRHRRVPVSSRCLWKVGHDLHAPLTTVLSFDVYDELLQLSCDPFQVYSALHHHHESPIKTGFRHNNEKHVALSCKKKKPKQNNRARRDEDRVKEQRAQTWSKLLVFLKHAIYS